MRLLAVRGVGDVGRTRHVVFCWIRGAVTTCFAVFPWTAFPEIYPAGLKSMKFAALPPGTV
jgi:hypothetical protein